MKNQIDDEQTPKLHKAKANKKRGEGFKKCRHMLKVQYLVQALMQK